MRILFVANPHMKLYKEIQSEMERQGHIVTCIEDKISSWDPMIHQNLPLPRSLKEKIWNYDLSRKWKWVVSHNKEFEKGFDLLFVLSGVSICKDFVLLLEKNNPKIKKVLYTWDPCNSYPFDRLLPLFDKAYTFDFQDSVNDNRWNLLPIYYTEEGKKTEKKIDIFSVGSNRVGRYSFIRKILPQIERSGLTSFIRIVVPIQKQTIKGRIISFLFPKKSLSIEEKETMEFSQGEKNPEIFLNKVMSKDEYDSISSSSRVILDDQKDGQYGLTARFMWAIGNHKKVITTNENVFNYCFVNKRIVSLIDKNNPVLPITFIKSENKNDDWPNIVSYRLDNWVKTILSFV